MMETMRVMSLDQKSRFLMLGPCSSGGTAFDWRQKDIMDWLLTEQEVLCSESTEAALKTRTDETSCHHLQTHVSSTLLCSIDLQGLSDIPCCTGRGSCWRYTHRWSLDRLWHSPSPPGLPWVDSAAPGPKHKSPQKSFVESRVVGFTRGFRVNRMFSNLEFKDKLVELHNVSWASVWIG